jgi:hypothetical protein
MLDATPPNQPCTTCGFSCEPDALACPQCGALLIVPTTLDIEEYVEHLPVERGRKTLFAPGASVVIQFEPSGVSLSVPLDEPVILGRGGGSPAEVVLDLSNFNGHEKGVSRRHCLLRRRGSYLAVIDLGSANGTTLNGERLVPRHEVLVAHGDRLILGRLHVTLLFSQPV